MIAAFAVAALFYDYTSDQGYVYLSAKNFARFWHDDRINSVAIYLKRNHSADEVTNASALARPSSST